jgi:diguanylate cyclase
MDKPPDDNYLPPTRPLDRVRLLILDDDDNTRTMLAELLQLYGATTLTARSAQDAQCLMEQETVHLILSDIGLPDVDGYEFMRTLRRGLAHPKAHTPAVALTGYAQPDDERLAQEAGYNAFMAKPLDVEKLVALIANLTARGA